MSNDNIFLFYCLFNIENKIEIMDGEFGFISEEMTEGEFEEKSAKLSGMITRIRIEN